MDGGHLKMSLKERTRITIFSRVKDMRMSIKEASELLGISYRQALRIWHRYCEEGDEGLVHRSRGKPSNRRKTLETRDAILSVYKEQYDEFGPTLAAEKLLERDGYLIDHETLRRWLLTEGLWKKRRKRPRHRKQRERKARFGELVQMDGSHHRWFGDGAQECLMSMVDDATGINMALMREEETTEAAMRLLWNWIEKYGIPKALYVDRKNVYLTDRVPTLEEQLSGEIPMTQFGQACKKLNIGLIPAYSPQAKGRVERKHGVHQDRLVKELRLADIRDIGMANELLPTYIDSINAKFAVLPHSSVDFHRSVPQGLDLTQVFCFEETRMISNDWVVRYRNRLFQINSQSNLPPARQKVIVQEYLDGSIHLVYRDRKVTFKEIRKRSPEIPTEDTSTNKSIKTCVPSPDHPWRRFNLSTNPNRQFAVR
jgi:transposase